MFDARSGLRGILIALLISEQTAAVRMEMVEGQCGMELADPAGPAAPPAAWRNARRVDVGAPALGHVRIVWVLALRARHLRDVAVTVRRGTVGMFFADPFSIATTTAGPLAHSATV